MNTPVFSFPVPYHAILYPRVFGLIFLGSTLQGKPPVELILEKPPKLQPVNPQEKKRISLAVEKGIDFLRGNQLKNGTWIVGKPSPNPNSNVGTHNCPLGLASLAGLTLLECGIPPNDIAVQQALRFTRTAAPNSFRTYEISLAILFLDRIGDQNDRLLIKSLGLRLAAGQTHLGGWSYSCPIMNPAQETKLVELLRQKSSVDLPKMVPPPARVQAEKADNSNTQFAILGLWTARKHDLPLDYPLAMAERRFRLSESLEGWNYHWRQGGTKGYGTMTCAGLLALGAGRGSAELEKKVDMEKNRTLPTDEGLAFGLRALGIYMADPSDTKWGGLGASPAFGPKGFLNLYFLWSIERVAVFCNLDTIGGKDWYRWGVDLLLPAQREDGSWLGRGSGGYPQVDTCFALLFLKKSDLLPDLRETLQKRILITDPGLDLKAPFDPKKTDKFDPKTFIPKKNPGEKGSPGTKEKLPAPDAPLVADLGDVKPGQSAKLPLRVRGPVPFKISAIKGADDHLRVDPPAGAKEVHELTVLLRPEKTGPFQRTLILHTDIPGRPVVAIEIKVRVAP